MKERAQARSPFKGNNMTVMCLKLDTGEELIGDVVVGDETVTIKDPASIHVVPSQNGSMGIGMMPWLSYADKVKFIISKSRLVVDPFEPVAEFLNKYNKMFGSGIQIANQLPL